MGHVNPELAFHQPSPLEVFPQGSLSASSKKGGGRGRKDCFCLLEHYSTEYLWSRAWEKLRHESPDGYITSTGGAAQVAGYQIQRGRTHARRDLQLQPELVEDAMHDVIYAWPSSRRKYSDWLWNSRPLQFQLLQTRLCKGGQNFQAS